MVLAPCAVVHAAIMQSAPHAMSASDHSHGQHVDCHAGQNDTDHAVCSGDCDTLQRVASADAPERFAPTFSVSYVALLFALNFAAVARDNRSSVKVADESIESDSDSKTVLRRTARLRL
jgi:hypothetical protein